jgi:cytochrome c oxidase subunit 3
MQKDFDKELSPEVREKMKKNLVYVGILSVVMLFAGLTSAYIVSMGDAFWLKFDLPSAFYISTAVIVLSSITFELAKYFIKKGNGKALKIFIVLTFLLGIGFIYFQFKAYNQMIDNGAHPLTNRIIVTEGRYGDYFELKYKGDYLEVNGNDFFLKGKAIDPASMKAIQSFLLPFEKVERNKPYTLKNYGKDVELFYELSPLKEINGELVRPDSTALTYVELLRLRDLAINIGDGRGDFFVKGKYGVDFDIYFKGKALAYENRTLKYNGQALDKYMQIKAMDSTDQATHYLYLITFVHLLHILISLLYLIKLVKNSFTGVYTSSDYISLKVGSIFWHFLGVLWVYLLLFLLFIH